MRKLIITNIAALLIGLSSCYGNSEKCDREQYSSSDMNGNQQECCNADSIELSGIKHALDLYVEAAVKGDSKIAHPAFAPTATMSYVDGDSLVSGPINALFDYYDNTGAHAATYRIVSCDVAEDVAIVRIESKFADTEFTDMFTLAKDGESWKIVSKVYHKR